MWLLNGEVVPGVRLIGLAWEYNPACRSVAEAMEILGRRGHRLEALPATTEVVEWEKLT